MTTVRRATACAYVGAVAVTVGGAVGHRPAWQYAAKPLLMPILAVRVAPPEPVLAAGLAAATVGDVFMIDPDDDRRLAAGAASFAVMHACWSTLLLRRGATLSSVFPRLLAWAAGVVPTVRRAPRVAPVLAAYGLVLGTTGALSAGPDRRLLIGGTLFTLSDALVLARRIAITDPSARRWAEAVVLVTYAGAQWLLVDALAGPG